MRTRGRRDQFPRYDNLFYRPLRTHPPNLHTHTHTHATKMVMKRRQKLRARAAALSTPPSRVSEGVTKVSSKGQRKRAKRKQRLENRRALAQQPTQNGAPSGLQLEGLREVLDEAANLAKDEKPSASGGVPIKRRKNLVRIETLQATSVREHPIFKKDPIEALRQHLLNTVCPNPAAVPPKPGSEEEKKKGKKTKEKKTPKFDIDKESMAIAREAARERVREKREQKAEMARAAQKIQRRSSLEGVTKVRKSPLRGRIGVKRPKLLADTK